MGARQPKQVLQPYPYQVQAIDAIMKSVAAGLRALVVSLPTGTGKAILGLLAGIRLGRVLFLGHRRELLDQPFRSLKRYELLGSIDYDDPALVGFIDAKNNDAFASRIVFASIDALKKRILTEKYRHVNPFDAIVYDECHHSVAKGNRKVVEFFRAPERLKQGALPPVLIGATATTKRADGVGLHNLYDAIAFKMTLEDAIRGGFLVPYVAGQFRVEKLDLRNVHRTGEDGDFDEEELAAEYEKAGVAAATARAVKEQCGDRKTLVFTLSVEQARKTCEELLKLGLKADWVCGDKKHTPEAKREQVATAFARREIQVVCNAMLWVEGFDDRDIEAVVIARNTASPSLYQQLAGRGLRTPENKLVSRKKDCLLIDLAGGYEIHGLCSAIDLGGSSLDEELDVVDEYEDPVAREEREESTEEEEKKRKRDLELERVRAFLAASALATPMTEFSVRRQAWIEFAPGFYALPLGGALGEVVMRRAPHSDLWTAEVSPSGVVLIEVPVPVQVAQEVSEGYASKLGALEVSAKAAEWRHVAASASEVQRARATGLTLPSGTITQGHVADVVVAAGLRTRFAAAIEEARREA